MLIPLKLSGPIRSISLRIGMQVVLILCRSLLWAYYQLDIWTHLLFGHHQENITNQVSEASQHRPWPLIEPALHFTKLRRY